MPARFAAHPLVVAVAFGLLGPAAVADDDLDLGEADASALDGDSDAIDPAEYARVEAEWLAVRGLPVD